ncbi:MAG: ABC transporter ATP-binding protein [Acidimicrobiales bacterium]
MPIETVGLTKRFGSQTAVDGVDLAVPEGSVFGFLGPNGSGKTTTIRMLLGLAFPDSGEVRLLGRDMPGAGEEVLPAVGTLVEGPAFYPFLSGRVNLERFDAVGRDGDRSTRTSRIDDALERVGLGAAAGKRTGAYSLGMRQRLALAATLVRPCRLLILDEPTNGLDPQGTREVRSLIRSLAVDGTTVFLSSHLLAEVEQLCTHAAVMSVGRVVAQGPLDSLRTGGAPMLRVETPDAELAAEMLARMPGVGATSCGVGEVRAELVGALAEECASILVQRGVRVRALVTERASLEDAFVKLTGEGFDVAQ